MTKIRPKFPVPENFSISWCWPFPDGQWYMMRHEDDKELVRLHQAEGRSDTPTHPQKIRLIARHGWMTKKIGNFIHVAQP